MSRVARRRRSAGSRTGPAQCPHLHALASARPAPLSGPRISRARPTPPASAPARMRRPIGPATTTCLAGLSFQGCPTRIDQLFRERTGGRGKMDSLRLNLGRLRCQAAPLALATRAPKHLPSTPPCRKGRRCTWTTDKTKDLRRLRGRAFWQGEGRPMLTLGGAAPTSFRRYPTPHRSRCTCHPRPV